MHDNQFSARVSIASAVFLAVGGFLLLFIPDLILDVIGTDVPTSAAWLGQSIGAGWLAIGALNWLSRGAVLGGIYGRPVVAANAALYFITAMNLIRHGLDNSVTAASWLAAAVMLVWAGIYGWLLLRGPVRTSAQ